MKIVCEHCHVEFDVSDGFFCPKCSFLNKLQGSNFFTYFGFLQTLDIDTNILEKKYLTMMNKYHPDKLINKSDKEKNYALDHSAYLNDAYNTLKSKKETIGYLYLILYNIDLRQESNNNDYQFNLEFFDLYEELDILNTQDDIKIFINKISNKEEKIINCISDENLKDQKLLKQSYTKLQYLHKIKLQAKLK